VTAYSSLDAHPARSPGNSYHRSDKQQSRDYTGRLEGSFRRHHLRYRLHHNPDIVHDIRIQHDRTRNRGHVFTRNEPNYSKPRRICERGYFTGSSFTQGRCHRKEHYMEYEHVAFASDKPRWSCVTSFVVCLLRYRYIHRGLALSLTLPSINVPDQMAPPICLTLNSPQSSCSMRLRAAIACGEHQTELALAPLLELGQMRAVALII
jgi:hypothetical protein